MGKAYARHARYPLKSRTCRSLGPIPRQDGQGGLMNGANGAPPPLLAQPQSVGSQGLRGRPPVVLSRSCGRLNRCLPRWVALHGLGEHPQSVRYSCVLQAPRRCVSGWPQCGQARRMPPSRRFVIFQMSSPGRSGGIPSHSALISDGEPTRYLVTSLSQDNNKNPLLAFFLFFCSNAPLNCCRHARCATPPIPTAAGRSAI